MLMWFIPWAGLMYLPRTISTRGWRLPSTWRVTRLMSTTTPRRSPACSRPTCAVMSSHFGLMRIQQWWQPSTRRERGACSGRVRARAGCRLWPSRRSHLTPRLQRHECARASASCIHEVVLSWCSKQGFLRTAQCRICLKWGARSSLHVHRPPQDPAGPPAPRPPYHLQPVALSAITRARTLGHGGCAAASRAVLRELVVT
mmetsp:Transcript_59061/g.131651  ORF Transcript_59061/g.131651 Transcript_59061/m.131651 type:complete len:201 (-) Transcript_59061:55-657(-)